MKSIYVTVHQPQFSHKPRPKLEPNISIMVDIITFQNEKIIEKLQELIDLLKSESEDIR